MRFSPICVAGAVPSVSLADSGKAVNPPSNTRLTRLARQSVPRRVRLAHRRVARLGRSSGADAPSRPLALLATGSAGKRHSAPAVPRRALGQSAGPAGRRETRRNSMAPRRLLPSASRPRYDGEPTPPRCRRRSPPSEPTYAEETQR